LTRRKFCLEKESGTGLTQCLRCSDGEAGTNWPSSTLPLSPQNFKSEVIHMSQTDGIPVYGTVKTPDHEFVTAISGAQLLKITRDPRDSENAKLRAGSRELQDLFQLREEVQRMFKGAKEKNVESYARYIVKLNNSDNGVTPQIVLFTREPLLFEPNEQGSPFGRLFLPWDVEWVAIDGETNWPHDSRPRLLIPKPEGSWSTSSSATADRWIGQNRPSTILTFCLSVQTRQRRSPWTCATR